MKGTEKQIKYANDIIESARRDLEGTIVLTKEKIAKEKAAGFGVEEMFERRLAALEEVLRQFEATVEKLETAAQVIENKWVFSHEYLFSAVDKLANKKTENTETTEQTEEVTATEANEAATEAEAEAEAEAETEAETTVTKEQIREVVKEFKDGKRAGLYPAIYYNKETGDLWVSQHASVNNWMETPEKVVELAGECQAGYWGGVTVDNLAEAINSLK